MDRYKYRIVKDGYRYYPEYRDIKALIFRGWRSLLPWGEILLNEHTARAIIKYHREMPPRQIIEVKEDL